MDCEYFLEVPGLRTVNYRCSAISYYRNSQFPIHLISINRNWKRKSI